MSLAKNILLFGATGTIGSFILDAILPVRAQFNRVAIFTSPHTAETKAAHLEKLKQQNVEVIIGSVEDEEAIKAAYEGMNLPLSPISQSQSQSQLQCHIYQQPTGIDTIISALGRNTLAQQIPLIRLAAASPSVKWFLPSEYGTDIKYGPASAHEIPHQQKLKVRAYIENEVSRDDLSYSYVVTGPFAEMYLNLVPGVEEAGGWDVRGRKAVLLGERGDEEISLTTMKE
jgi:hypothetical protein